MNDHMRPKCTKIQLEIILRFVFVKKYHYFRFFYGKQTEGFILTMGCEKQDNTIFSIDTAPESILRKKKQGGPNPMGLKRWPLKLVKHLFVPEVYDHNISLSVYQKCIYEILWC